MANQAKLLVLIKEHLDPGEEVVVSVFGAYETKILGNDSVRNGILAATPKRLIFFSKKLLGYEMEVFPWSNISSFESGKGILGHKLSFFASGNRVNMKWITSTEIKEFIEYSRSQIGRKQESSSSPPEPANGSNDIIAQIEKLGDLRDRGIIDDDEFKQKKTELLAKL